MTNNKSTHFHANSTPSLSPSKVIDHEANPRG